ncbi:MAG TPA: hypothetical protein VHL59_09465 [Thermoanaerobaculia bacterium]|nr:hypothetical protein [Thermoanaerobaculia bacterium]
MKRALLLLAVLAVLAASPLSAAECETTCADGSKVRCSGNSCHADSSGVECTTTTNCGTGCTEVTTRTVRCQGETKPGQEPILEEEQP